MPACLGFAGYTPCVDNDDAVPEYATALGVTEVSTCADVLTNGYCPNVPPDLLHHCCASCAGSADDSVRLSRGSRGRGSGCSKDNQCSSGDCGDWTNHDLRCCPERNGVRRGRSDSNRWDQCGNLPSGSPCKNWDGSQCVGGRCHNWRCTADCDRHSDCAGGSGDKHSPVHSSVCEMYSLTSAHLALGTDWEECWRPDGGECSDLSCGTYLSEDGCGTHFDQSDTHEVVVEVWAGDVCALPEQERRRAMELAEQLAGRHGARVLVPDARVSLRVRPCRDVMIAHLKAWQHLSINHSVFGRYATAVHIA